MPGSPPSSSTEPRTKPPPVTRSSSLTPDTRRGASWLSPASGSSWNTRPLRGGRPGPAAPTPESVFSSTMVFHSPQDSHLPCHRDDAAPQFWQTKVALRLAMAAAILARLGEAAPYHGGAGEYEDDTAVWGIEGRVRAVARQDRLDNTFRTGSGVDGNGLGSTSSGFALVDVMATWRPLPNVTLQAGIENLFDKAYAEHIERTDIDDPFLVNQPAAGRSLVLRGAMRF